MPALIIGILQNAAMLLALAFIYDVVVLSRVDPPEGRLPRFSLQVVTGISLGLVGVGVMASRWNVQPGVILDTRSVLLTAVGLFFGIVPLAIAMIMTALYRLYLGGSAALTGVAVIMVTGLIGFGARYRREARLESLRWRELLAIGFVVHIAMLLTFVVVPFDGSSDALRRIALPVLGLYPPIFALLGMLMVRRLQAAQLRRDLAESEARYRSVFDNEHLVTLVIDPVEGSIVDANERAARYYGWSRSELLHMNASDLEVLPRDEVLDVVHAAQRDGRSTFELQHRMADGRIRDVEVLGGEIQLRGRPLVYVVINDITEQNQADDRLQAAHDQLRQAQKMEAVGRLAGGIAHDFNNMLQVILGYADLALHDADPASTQHQSLTEIKSAATRSAELTQQLLAFARKQTVNPVVIDVNESIANTAKLLRRVVGEHIEITPSPGADVWPARIDPGQFDQALTNLALNARDAMPDGGRIEIATFNETIDDLSPDGAIEVRPGDFVVIRVTDTGHGMSPDVLASAFEPFFTTKSHDQGTGLGLAIVYGVITQHDGFIRAESTPDVGTTFRLYIPRAEQRQQIDTPVAPSPPPLEESHNPSAVGATVLLVEDESSVLRLSATTLSAHGYAVVAAHSGAEALERARLHPGPIDLLVTDVVMPGLDGRELAAQLTAERPGTPVLFVSGYTDDVIAAHGVIDPGVHLLGKPFSADQLLSAVDSLIRRKHVDVHDPS